MKMEKISDVTDVVPRNFFFKGGNKMEVSSSYINTYKALVVHAWGQQAPAAGPLQPSAEDVLAVILTNLFRRIGTMAFQAMANAQPPRTSLDAEAVTTALYALFQGELRFFATQAVDLALENPNDVAQPPQNAVHRHLRDRNQVMPVRFRATRIVVSGAKALAAVLAFFAQKVVAECKSGMRDRGLTSLSGAMVVQIVRTANQLHVLEDMNVFPSGYLSSSSSDSGSEDSFPRSEPRDDSPLTPWSTSPPPQQPGQPGQPGVPPPMPPLMLPPPYIPLHLQNPPPPYERWSPASTIASGASLSSEAVSLLSSEAAAASSSSSLPYARHPPSPASTLSSSQGGGLLPPLQFQLQAHAPPPPNFIVVTAGELRDLLTSHRQYIVAYLEHNVSRQQFRERFMNGNRCAARGSDLVQQLLTDSGIDVLVAVDGRQACDAVVEAFVDRYGL